MSSLLLFSLLPTPNLALALGTCDGDASQLLERFDQTLPYMFQSPTRCSNLCAASYFSDAAVEFRGHLIVFPRARDEMGWGGLGAFGGRWEDADLRIHPLRGPLRVVWVDRTWWGFSEVEYWKSAEGREMIDEGEGWRCVVWMGSRRGSFASANADWLDAQNSHNVDGGFGT